MVYRQRALEVHLEMSVPEECPSLPSSFFEWDGFF